MNSGPGIYFDGVTSARHDVTVALTPGGLQISTKDGGKRNTTGLMTRSKGLQPRIKFFASAAAEAQLWERLEILDAALAAEIDARAAYVDRSQPATAPAAHEA